MRITRLCDRPIIEPATDPSIGENIQGPSLIRSPAVAGERGIAIAEIAW